MLRGLKRKLVILSVLVAAFAAVSSAPTSHARGGVFCDEAPIDSGCTPGTLLCCNDYGGCWCQ
jgi:hypothetical protein